MRLMLGRNNQPELLIEVSDQRSPADFDFYVVNGAWEGKFTDGVVTVLKYGTVHEGVEVLTDNQDRLRGNYQTVFDNFDNPDYVAPKSTFEIPESWEDDIPF
jgi:hypothetical protein